MYFSGLFRHTLPRDVSAAGILYFNNPCSHIGQYHGAVWPGYHATQVKYKQAVQGSGIYFFAVIIQACHLCKARKPSSNEQPHIDMHYNSNHYCGEDCPFNVEEQQILRLIFYGCVEEDGHSERNAYNTQHRHGAQDYL